MCYERGVQGLLVMQTRGNQPRGWGGQGDALYERGDFIGYLINQNKPDKGLECKGSVAHWKSQCHLG